MKKREKELTNMLNVRLTNTLLSMCQQLAKNEYLTTSSFVRRAIENSVQEIHSKKLSIL